MLSAVTEPPPAVQTVGALYVSLRRSEKAIHDSTFMRLTHSSLLRGGTTMYALPRELHTSDLLALYEPVFELKKSPFQEPVGKAAENGLQGVFGHFDDDKLDNYLKTGWFDLYVALAFPNADAKHLETCLYFLLWAFSADDITDEGEFQSNPQNVQVDVDKSGVVVHNPESPRPAYPYAAMLHDVLKRLRSSSYPQVYTRFCAAWEVWTRGQVKQSGNRSLSVFPSVEEFIAMRRATIGGALVEAMVQYSLDIELPDEVLEHPNMKGISDAAIDLMAWPNKEQADGDLQNLVCILMVMRRINLQEAVNVLITMITDRIDDYAQLKSGLPSFGSAIDEQLGLYLKNLEHFIQGTVRWYYSSPRVEDVSNLEIKLMSH
ncbi:isoprenoid synthase domain-containing protein [Irpex lacteus]|nr:isoprenoid synthase domain-containing protein [Irpex lacteus]